MPTLTAFRVEGLKPARPRLACSRAVKRPEVRQILKWCRAPNLPLIMLIAENEGVPNRNTQKQPMLFVW